MQSSALFCYDDSYRLNTVRRRSNQQWLDALRGPGRETAIAELRALLLRGLHYGLKSTLKRRGALEHVEDFAQEGLIKVLDNLDSFRGESRFTTWAQKIAMRVAYSELRRKRWENVSLDSLQSIEGPADSAPVYLPDSAPTPAEQVAGQMSYGIVRDIIDNRLTRLQREAIHLIIVHDIPIEEVADEMGTNRNALYKLLHDARRRVRIELHREGLTPEQMLEEASPW